MPILDVRELESLSIQSFNGSANVVPGMFSGGTNLWLGTDVKDGLFDLVPPWWSQERDRYLESLVYMTGNDILSGALASLSKRFTSMSWALEGPEKAVSRYHNVLIQANFGRGWPDFISKMVQTYSYKDKGSFAELLGGGPLDGPIVGGVRGIRNIYSDECILTSDNEYPVIVMNPKNQKMNKLHRSRVAHIVDLPSPNPQMNNTGYCAISRVLSSTEILRQITSYKNEKLSDLPPAGLLMFSNVAPTKWEEATKEHKIERVRKGQEYWSSIMTFFGIDPNNRAFAEFIPFSSLPEAFNEKEAIELYLNVLALAFGVDTREFWPVFTGFFGSEKESHIQHQKAKGKFFGDFIAAVERFVNWMVLPPSVTFHFDFVDDEEDQRRAEIEELKTRAIMRMWEPPKTQAELESGAESPASQEEMRQMLADQVSYFSEDFLSYDITEDISLTDVTKKALGPYIVMNREGKRKQPKVYWRKRSLDDVMFSAAKNYAAGRITFDEFLDLKAELMTMGSKTYQDFDY